MKCILSDSNVNTQVYGAQSTRHASTSAALRKGINIEIIRDAAGWTKDSEVFARFYNRPLLNEIQFASYVN